MIKPFFVLLGLLMMLVGMVSIHYFYSDDETSQKMLQNISSITQVSSASLSVAYYEPRVLFYEKMDNPAYPQMLSINKMDFVYAR